MKPFSNIEKLLLAETTAEQENLLKSIVRASPTNVVACIKLGSIYRKKGFYSDAIRIHKNILSERGLSADVVKEIYVNIIKDYVSTGKHKASLPYVEKLLSLAKTDCDMLSFIYSFYENCGYWKEAINLKYKILRIKKTSDNRGIATLHAFLGNTMLKNENNKEGVANFKKALSLDKLNIPALLFLGDFYYSTGKTKEAVGQWKQILENLPDYAFLVFERLEIAYFESSEFQKLEAIYTSFIERYQDNVRVIAMLAEIYAKKGSLEEAIKLLERAKTIEPDNIKIRKTLLKLYYNSKQYDELFKEGKEIFAKSKYTEFKCYKCNSKLIDFEFKCPHCSSWLTIR